jgi:hypothetical protein
MMMRILGCSNPAAALRAVALLLSLTLLAGCVGAQANNSVQGNVAQIIVKFRPSVADPNTPEFLQDLSRTAGAKASYFRAMSGDAHVMRLSGLKTEAALAQAIKRLSERPDVEYAEIDQKRMPLKQGDK